MSDKYYAILCKKIDPRTRSVNKKKMSRSVKIGLGMFFICCLGGVEAVLFGLYFLIFPLGIVAGIFAHIAMEDWGK